MDALLLPYLGATDESERQQHLDELLLLYAAPIVRITLRHRLGLSVSLTGTNPSNQRAQDLYQDIMLRIVQALNDLKSSPENRRIIDFRKYVRLVATNVCRDYLRSRSPARRRLRDNIRLILARHPDFALWQTKGPYVCGFAVWQERGTPLQPWQRQDQMLDEEIEAFRSATYPRQHPTRLPVSKVLSDLFEWTDAPIYLDTVVKILTRLLDVKDDSVEAFDEESEASLEASFSREIQDAQSLIEEKELLRRAWQAVKRLPGEQRDAYCLLFHDERGWDFFSLLIEAEIVTLVELSQVLGRSPKEINRLRSQMPMDGPTAAAELNVPRPQVNKWRFLALKRVRESFAQ
jgi:RNA polymerase sigma factor (sigma-70 family)